MPRPPRISSKNFFYHVFARGNNREQVFWETADYQRFLKNLELYQEKFGYRLYAYCLLANHFHLLLRPGKISLSKIMQVLMTAYSMYANKKHHRVGHVFQGRFKSIIVEKDTYLLEVLRYIHLNPIRAGIVDRDEEYPWSSYLKYLTAGSEKPTVETAEMLSMFSPDGLRQKRLFVEFTEGGLGQDFDPEQVQIRGVLGSAKFFQSLTRVLKGKRP